MGRFLLIGFSIVAALAAALGFSVRAIVNWRMAQAVEGSSGGPAPALAIAYASVMLLFLLWVLLDFY